MTTWAPCASPSGLALILNVRGETAVGGGWVARARRLLETQPDRHRRTRLPANPRVLPVPRSWGLRQGRPRRPLAWSTSVAASLHPDLVAQGLMCQGRLMIYAGRVPEGLALLDEAMIGISAGEVSPIFAGMVYCSMIEACQEVSDFSRAAAWTSALTRWCDVQPGLVPYTGQCSLHRGQIMRLRGAYEDALAEFALAQRRYQVEGTAIAGRSGTDRAGRRAPPPRQAR